MEVVAVIKLSVRAPTFLSPSPPQRRCSYLISFILESVVFTNLIGLFRQPNMYLSFLWKW